MGNKGFEAALAAVEMASLKTAVNSQPLRHSAQGRLNAAFSQRQSSSSHFSRRRNEKDSSKRSSKRR